MRLNEIKEIIDYVLPTLKVSASNVTINGSNYLQVTNANSLKKDLEELSQTGLFKKEINDLKESSLFEFTGNTVNLTPSDGQQLIQRIQRLTIVADRLCTALASIIQETKENTIYIKFPDIKDFNDLSKASESFNKIFSQTILDEEVGGVIQIETVENGSIWFELYLGTIKAVSVIGSITLSAALAFREYKKGLYIAESTRTRKIKNDRLQELQKAHKLLLDHLIDAEAYSISNSYFNEDVPERINRIKHAIKTLSEEMERGAEILPSKKVLAEIADLFPDMKNLPGLISKIKEIEDGDEDLNESLKQTN